MIRRRTADRSAEGSGTLGEMEYLAHLDTAPEEVVTRSLDVGDHQEHALRRSWCALAGLSEVNRSLGSRRGELDRAVIAVAEVGVETPAKTLIELLCAVHVRDREGDHLELPVDLPDAGVGGRVFATDCSGGHGFLLGCVSWQACEYRT